MPAYLKRVVDEALARHLRLMPAVILQGPKGCGKTTSAAQLCASKAILDAGHDATLARTDPALVLPGATPRLLDEWQVFPDLWNLVRHEVDRRNQSGQFILAGSARPVDDVGRHSGAGRFATVTMRTLSLYDSAAANLTRVVDTVDTSRVGAPAGLVVITASGAAYTRPDGVRVVPITTLGP